MITTCNLVPAGTHRGRAIVDALLEATREGCRGIPSLMWCGTRGTPLCKAATTAHPLAQAGIAQTFQPVTHQRGSRAFLRRRPSHRRPALLHPISPEVLHDLPAPPRGASEDEKRTYEAKFNQRARWRLFDTPVPMATASPGGAAPSVPLVTESGRSPRP